MGFTVTAHLGYGVHVPYERYDELPWAVVDREKDEEMDEDEESEPDDSPAKLTFEDWIAQLAGLESPCGDNVDWVEWNEDPANAAAMIAYWESCREAVNSCPIKVIEVSAGEYEDPVIIIAVPSTVTRAYWPDPTPAATLLSVNDLTAAVEFCSQHTVPFENPQWLLVAEYTR